MPSKERDLKSTNLPPEDKANSVLYLSSSKQSSTFLLSILTVVCTFKDQVSLVAHFNREKKPKPLNKEKKKKAHHVRHENLRSNNEGTQHTVRQTNVGLPVCCYAKGSYDDYIYTVVQIC